MYAAVLFYGLVEHNPVGVGKDKHSCAGLWLIEEGVLAICCLHRAGGIGTLVKGEGQLLAGGFNGDGKGLVRFLFTAGGQKQGQSPKGTQQRDKVLPYIHHSF